MKKKLSFVFIFVFFSSIIYAKNIYKKEGSIKGNYSNESNNKDYKLEINSDNENSAIFRNYLFGDGICIVKNGESISINYSEAKISGGSHGVGSTASTVLHITKSGKEIDYKNPIVIKKNEIYYLTLYYRYTSTYNSPNDTKLISILIIGVDESIDISLIDRIANFKGYICEYYDTKFDSPGGPILELTNNKVIGIYAGNYKFQKK